MTLSPIARWAAAFAATAVILIAIGHRTLATAEPNDVARGNYLVMDAGKCSDCHGEKLTGQPNFINGPPGVPWATKIPQLAGLQMFKNDADAVKFLMTGVLPDGKTALGPMPQYRFNEADATAIVAYLRSLK